MTLFPSQIYLWLMLSLLVSPDDLVAGNLRPHAPVDQSDAQKWRDDLRFMAEEMPKAHRNLFHSTSREQFYTAVESLNKRIPTLARHEIILEMARIVAMVGDGHTNISPTRDPKIGFHSYPIRLYFFDDGLFVRAASREYADLVGSRVVGIGDSTVEQAYSAVRSIIGRDNEMGARFFAPFLLAMPEVLHALHIIDNMDKTRFTIERHGERKEVVLSKAEPADMLPPDTDTSWRLKTGWVDARESGQAPFPLWLHDPLNTFWYEYLPESGTVYVQFNQVANKDTETVEAFSQRLFDFAEAAPVARFVLDLRLNRGGNGELNRPLLLGIIRCTRIDRKGKFFTIIGRSTWSAAQFLVNDLERFTNTIFVGEPTGGKVNSYGDSRKITLPNSGITVRVSTLWWQQDERDRRPWTAPQVAADLSFEDYRNSIDPALQAILQYAPEEPLSRLLMKSLSMDEPAALIDAYGKWKASPVNKYLDAEPELNTLGYQLLGMKRTTEAIAVFSLCVDEFPLSANAHDSMGEAYIQAGQPESAIRHYRKSLELNPGNRHAVEMLHRLGK